MAIHRTRKNKTAPNYGFLVSWQPSQPHVKGELKSKLSPENHKPGHAKSADILAQAAIATSLKKGLIKSLVLVSFILILELVLYLGWKRFLP